MRKGQATTEYLLILTTVLIVVSILVVIIGDHQRTGSTLSQRAQAIDWKTNTIGIKSASIGTVDQFELYNNNPWDIRLTKFNITLSSNTSQTFNVINTPLVIHDTSSGLIKPVQDISCAKDTIEYITVNICYVNMKNDAVSCVGSSAPKLPVVCN